jgi:Glycogen recognition site of AMP-activated protein kinase
MKQQDDKIRDNLVHHALDGANAESEAATGLTGPDAARYSRYRECLTYLETHQETAPADFTSRVMAALPEKPHLSWADRLKSFWPEGRFWPIPGIAGALAMALLLAGLTLFQPSKKNGLIPVVLDLYAPSANRVQLVGTFSGWMPEDYPLKGPDAVGYWVININLPPGRHEYAFLVNGSRLVPDDDGEALRQDGFGGRNSLIVLKDIEGEFDQLPPFTVSEYADISHSLPQKARTILDSLFQNNPSKSMSKHVFLKLREGLLKKAQPDALKSTVHDRHAAFKKARGLLAGTGHASEITSYPVLLDATAFALESGFDPLSVKKVLIAGKGKTTEQIAAVIELGETLNYLEFEDETLLLIMKDCLSKNLDPQQIERVTEHVKEKLQKGHDRKTILSKIWV